MKSSMMALYALLLLPCFRAAAQDPGTAPPDTLEAEDRIGRVEEAEDLPVAELLDAEPATRPPAVTLRSRLIGRTRDAEGYRDGTYAGSRLKSYHRMKLSPGDRFSAGILIEKDPGERRLNDFTAWHVALRSPGLFRTIVIGDFTVESGLGVGLWKGAALAKGPDIAGAVLRKARGIVPYLSSGESAFLRGAAVGLQAGNWSINSFVSRRFLDGSVNQDGTVTSLDAMGYFRTEAEESKRGTLGEGLFGATIHFRDTPGGQIGLTAYRAFFSRLLELNHGDRFRGDRSFLVSCDYRRSAGAWTLFGEWGYANSDAGGSSGAALRPAAGTELVVSVRWYPYRFLSVHGNGFGERAGMSNERGFYFALSVIPARRMKLTAYADLFRFPGGTRAQPFSSGGSERFLQAEGQLAERCRLTLRYTCREEQAEGSATNSYGLFVLEPWIAVRRSIRVNADYRAAGGMRFRGRWEWVLLSPDLSGRAERGMMLLHELTAAPSAVLWWDFRVVIFRTSSYGARLYAYEPDLEGVTSVPVLYGEGIRWSCLVRYSLGRSLSLSVKYADHIRDDVIRIGTGAERLPGNHDAKVGLQLDLAL